MRVYVGGVQTWDTGLDPREQAVKMSEEVMEVFSAVDDLDGAVRFAEASPELDGVHGPLVEKYRGLAVDECCDVITATCNLLASLGVTDLRGAMERCAERQRERGRI